MKYTKAADAVSVGYTTIAGSGAAVGLAVVAVERVLDGDHTQQGLGAAIMAVATLMVTMIGRYAQAIAKINATAVPAPAATATLEHTLEPVVVAPMVPDNATGTVTVSNLTVDTAHLGLADMVPASHSNGPGGDEPEPPDDDIDGADRSTPQTAKLEPIAEPTVADTDEQGGQA